MARFFARFDSGSAGWESGFAAGLSSSNTPGAFFDRLRITGSSASAALLRDGLIASRSLLSADIYADLDDVNEDGSKGTYFPPDLLDTDLSTYVSWSSAYTSSVEGIKTPTSNTYGTGNVNYSLRVTASILSSSNLVGRTTPIDPVGASYTTYISASNAVKAVLDTAQTGDGTLITPYVRTGNNPSRTLHSIWYDPDLQYFGWDDFTPGSPATGQSDTFLLAISPSQSNAVSCSVRIEYEKSFTNDFNPDSKMDLRIDYISINGGGPRFTDFLQVVITGSEPPSGNKNRYVFTTAVLDCQSGIAAYDMHVTMSYFDPIITSSEGARTQFISNILNNMACGAGTQF